MKNRRTALKATAAALVAVFALSSTSFAAVDKGIARYLDDCSVTIVTARGQGSGVLVRRGEWSYVITAAHVVENLRSVRKAFVEGEEKSVVEFKDAQVMRNIYEGTRIVGETYINAKVIKYSDAEHGHDIAILLVRKKDYSKASMRFYRGPELEVGQAIVGMGSLLGKPGANSLTEGILSAHGRLVNQKEYMQTDSVSFPGSSGCGYYTTNGDYIGMLQRGYQQQGFNLIAPFKRLDKWAKSINFGWIFDDSMVFPTQNQLEGMPVE